MSEHISDAFPYSSNYIEVLGSKLHYIEQGQGDPILFLHGIPTSSYLWRNVIPYLSSLGRCIAVDMIGMGKSDKPKIEYTLSDHCKYIEKFIEDMHLKNLTLIMHECGSIVGLNYAMQHENNCKGLIFYEAFLRPLNEEDSSLPFAEQIQFLQQQKENYDYVEDGIYFVDQVLTQGMMRPLTQNEKKWYSEPYLQEGSGKPLAQYLNELEKGERINLIIKNYSEKLQKSNLPKLLLYSIPGFITTISTVMWAKEHLPQLEIVDVGEALHYGQETNPALIGEAMSIWLQGVEQTLPSEG